MRIRKVLVAAMVAHLAAGALAGCGGEKSDEEVIKTGVFEPTAGENGGGGYQEVLGICYARKTHPTINIGGEEYTVKLVEVGNKPDKIKAINAAQKLASEKASVVLRSYGPDVPTAAGQIFADAKILVIGCSCTNPQVAEGNDFYFRACLIDPFQGMVVANYVYQNGAKDAAMIIQLGDDYFSGLSSYSKDASAKLGGSIVSEKQFQTNQTDFKAILTNTKAANLDTILAPSSITTTSLITRQTKELGITATIAVGDTWENSTIIENAGANSKDVAPFTFFDKAESVNNEAAIFIKSFKEYPVKEEQEDIIPAASTPGYDSYLAVIKTTEDVGSIDIAAIHDAFRNVGIDGVTGDITLNETGDVNKDIAFIKTIKDGKFQFLTTTTVE